MDGNSSAFATQRLAQRATDALEAGFDHVVRVLAADADVNRRTEMSASERKKCGTSSVGSPPTTSRVKWPSKAEEGAAGQDRLRPARAPHPSAAESRSALMPAFEPSARRSASPSASAQSSTVWCSSICRSPLQCEHQREAAVLGELLEHVIEEADAGRDLRAAAVASRFTATSICGLARAPLRSLRAARSSLHDAQARSATVVAV